MSKKKPLSDQNQCLYHKFFTTKPLALFLLLIFVCNLSPNAYSNVIRVNQLGYLKDDTKRAIIGSHSNLQGQKFFVNNVEKSATAFSDIIGPPASAGPKQSPFPSNHIISFSNIRADGLYCIKLEDNTSSPPFKIGKDVYRTVIDSLLYFLKAARCGSTNPELHKPCHLYDATNTDLDLTGGWHDAGDFLKFTRSVSYVVYTLLLSYDLHKDHYSEFLSDLNHNALPDVLDEAKIGLDYLVKLFPDESTFVYRVGDYDADHSQGPRMPEDDRLARTNRPALFGLRRNDLSQYAFALALASSLFREIPQYRKEAEHYLDLAKRAYFSAKTVGTGHFDKLCLAATELYRTTHNPRYLAEAKRFNDKLSSSSWGNWSDNTNLAHARLAHFYGKALHKLKTSVAAFYNSSHSHLFGYNVPYTWSGLYVAISSASTGWLYKLLTNDNTYADLSLRIKDYILGLNPWGICFISGLGANYPKNIHNNLAVSLRKSGALKNASITGAIPGGPLNRTTWETKWSHLVPTSEDTYLRFQPSECVYYDHMMAYPTNEPCIYGSSEAILFFSFYLRHLSDR